VTWFALQSLFLILGAFALGIVVGWLVWGRQERQETIVVLHGDGTTRTMTRSADAAPVTSPAGTDDAPAPPPATPEEPTPEEPTPAAAPATEPTWVKARAAGSEPAAGRSADEPADLTAGEPAGTPATTEPAKPQPMVPEAGPAAPTGTTGSPAAPAAPRPASTQDGASTARGEAGAAEPEDEHVVDLREPAPAVVDLREDADDDLLRIVGVTPQVADALRDSDIRRYADLGTCDEFRLRGILRKAGLRFPPSLTSWPAQAGLLADGDDEGFAALSAQVAADQRTAGTA
jgi:predicted flap endonuclease-1-like 5' DNA nuclease